MHPFLKGLSPTLHIAHRGGGALAPENTVAAFDLAVNVYRTDMLELDVQGTRDGVLVVCHDDDLERLTGMPGRVGALDATAVFDRDAGFAFSPDGGQTHPFRGQGLRLSTLAEVLGRYPDTRFNVELKPGGPDLSEALADVVHDADATQRVCCGSEDDRVARALLTALPESCHFYPRLAATAFVVAARAGTAPDDTPFLVLDLPATVAGMAVVNEALLETAAHAGRWVNVWTVDDRLEMASLVALGVGGIMTDRPDVLREVLDGR